MRFKTFKVAMIALHHSTVSFTVSSTFYKFSLSSRDFSTFEKFSSSFINYVFRFYHGKSIAEMIGSIDLLAL